MKTNFRTGPGCRRLLGRVVPGILVILAGVWPQQSRASCEEIAEVALTSPANGASAVGPASFTFNAQVTGVNCPGRKVYFIVDGQPSFTDTASPWSYTKSNMLPGTYTVWATVQDAAGESNSAPVVVTVTNPISISLTSPSGGTIGQAPATFSIAASGSDSTGTIMQVDFYANGSLINSDSSAPFGYSWSGVGAGNYALTAKATDNHGVTATSAAVTVSSNSPPSATLTAPANGASSPAPASFTLSANASDSDGSISKVEFYSNGALVNTDTAAPYTYAYSGLGPGSYTITAKAYDNLNANTTSGGATVSVINTPPTVSLTTPGNNASAIAPATFILNASASDSDGSISKVEFYSGATLINTDTVVPFSFSYANVGVGNYALTAKAYDNYNAVTTSSVVNVSAIANGAPTVSLTSPANGSAATAPANLTVSANASDADGSVAKVEFFSNGALFATATSPPYSVSLANLGPGSYSLTAKATDNLGLSTTSIAAAVTVTAPAGNLSVTRSYVYDSYERPCKTIEPETGATIVDYDGASNVAWSVQGSSLTSATCDRGSVPGSAKITRSYDARNRVLSMLTPGAAADIVTTYFPDGAVATISANNPGVGPVINRYSYNKRRMLVTESVEEASPSLLFTTNYAYNPNGHLSSLQYPDLEVVGYSPNALGQPRQVGAYATGISYYPNGAIYQFTYGNGVLHTMTQNARQLPARSRDAYGSTVVLDDSYIFDKNGNVSDITDQAQGGLTTRGMSYDSRDRLQVAVAPGLWGDAAFVYDGVDNLVKVDQGSRHYRYSYSSNQRLAQINDPNGVPQVVLGYDANGNVNSKNGQTLVFDVANRLTQLTGVQYYRYDGLGRRVQTTDQDGKYTFWQYSQAGQVLFASEARQSRNTAYIYLGNTQLAARHVAWGSGTVTIDYQHTDALGSPVAETNSTGAVTKRNTYTPYGEASSGAIDGPGFTGHVMDAATGLTYMQQRYYDPQIGRFLSVDPVATDSNTGGNFNRYWYANNSPYRFSDPDGRSALAVVGGAFEVDVAVPEPTDAAWPKWVGWGIAFAGAAAIDYLIVNNESSDGGSPSGDSKAGDAFPDRPLPRKPNGEPAPEEGASGPHTQLGSKEGRNGKYPQAREFDSDGKPVRDIDFTDHGGREGHGNPHQHPYKENKSGGTKQRGKAEPLSPPPTMVDQASKAAGPGGTTSSLRIEQ
ncbi:Ig-like domain-containing protein [Lysobacter sp. TAF61]|uniref:Ig-like domain-containing protein n=1 Tax=Lysobacter sp. TAF61 TaxID=3233072 RepID=UPI003F959B65